MELKDYMNILLRRKWVIIITVLAAIVAVVIGTRMQTPMYESHVTLRVATSSGGSGSAATYTTQRLNTVAQIATSSPVMNEMMSKLNLTYEPEVTAEVIVNTELIKITVLDPSAQTAADAAGTLGDILISQSNSVYTGGGTNAVTVLGTQVAQAEKDILETRQKYNSSLLATPAAVAQADLLYQQLVLEQRNYDSLLSQYQTSQYQSAMQANMITVVEAPIVEKEPAKPVLLYNLIIGLAAGLVGGVVLAFIINSFDTTLYNTQEIEQYSGLGTFARIPKVRKSATKLTVEGTSAFTDSFRELAMKIQQVDRKRPVKIILVFSAEPNQGKSMIVSHLGVSLTEFDKRVVAVDCDMRMPKLHKWFDLPNVTGLKDILEEKAEISEALQQTHFEGLWVITSGENVEKPTLLLGSQRMKRLVATLSRKFDYVLLDTPALLAVGDAAVISESADGLLLVARRKDTTREAAKSAGSFLKNFPDKFTALIVNQDSSSDGYYYRRNQPEEDKLSSAYILKRLGNNQEEYDEDATPRKTSAATRHIEPEVEDAVVAMAMEQPLYGQIRVSNELRKRAIYVSPGCVRTIWLRHGLETFEKRNQALESRTSGEASTYTESQLEALEKAKAEKDAEAETDSEYPGNLGVQDSFHIGMIDGIGRIYQQTFIDTYSGFAFAKIYYRKNTDTAVDLFENRVLPFFNEENIKLERVLTDQDSIYCGDADQHPFEMSLHENGCKHDCTEAWHPKTNGISMRFHKLIRDEFYQATLRKKTYETINDLQQDLDEWVKNFNYERAYPGKYCYGRTPYQTLQAMKQIAQSEIL